MALYSLANWVCGEPGCDKPYTHEIKRSGTDTRGYACKQHVAKVGKRIAATIGEEWVG